MQGPIRGSFPEHPLARSASVDPELDAVHAHASLCGDPLDQGPIQRQPTGRTCCGRSRPGKGPPDRNAGLQLLVASGLLGQSARSALPHRAWRGPPRGADTLPLGIGHVSACRRRVKTDPQTTAASSRHCHHPGRPPPAEQPLRGAQRQRDRAGLPGRRRHPTRRGAGRQRPGRRRAPAPASGRPVRLLALRRLPEQAGLQALAIDLRCYGRCACPPPDDAKSRVVDDVAGAVAALRANGAKRIALVGSSLGASTALLAGAALRPPVAAVVSLSTGKFDLATILGGSKPLDTYSAAKRLTVPVLFAAARDDPNVPRRAGPGAVPDGQVKEQAARHPGRLLHRPARLGPPRR
jgi:hypothetical protein